MYTFIKRWLFAFGCAVSIWYDERHYCFTLWAYYTFGMCQGDGASPPVRTQGTW